MTTPTDTPEPTDAAPAHQATPQPTQDVLTRRFCRRAFLLLLAFGLVWQVLVPAFHTPDEPNHIFRAYMLSEGRVWDWETGEDFLWGHTQTGANFPRSFYDAMETSGFLDTRWQPTRKVDPANLREAWAYRLSDGDPMFYGFPNTVVYPPLAYIPQVIVTRVLRALDSRVMTLATALRLVNFLIYAALIWLALRALPALHQPIMLAVLSPIAVQQAFAPGADGFVSACALLYLAHILRLRLAPDPPRITRRHLALLAVVAVFMTVPKVIYFPLCWAALTIPLACWGSRRRQLTGLGILCGLPLLLDLLWLGSLAVNGSTMFDSMFGGDAAPTAEPRRTITETVTMMGHSAWINLTELRFWEGLVGGLGWVDTLPPAPLAILYPIALVALVVLQPTAGVRLTWRDGVVWGGCALASLVLAQYSVLSSINGDVHHHIQGRYFLPLFPFLLASLYALHAWLRPHLTRPLHPRWTLLLATASLLTMTITLKLRFFG